MKTRRLLLPLLAGFALVSCAQTPPAAAPAPASAPAEIESTRLGRELRELIGTAPCSADSQCRTVAIGAKACGGPSGYLAWSTQATDARAVAALAERQAAAQRREVASSGLRSNCAIVSDPGATCMAGRCQLTSSAS
jgi:hypothetical protein